MIRKIYEAGVLGLFLLLCGSCQKYETLEPIAGDTYMRVFNTITNCEPGAVFTNTQKDIVNNRTLCLLIDPQQDAGGHFTGADQIGDFLGGRSYYAAPYETVPGDDVSRYYNTEYPGAYRVQTAGIINGLDLSRWERITPGKHRLVILRRMPAGPSGGTYFTVYTLQGRDTAFKTAIDTTLDLNQNTIYTLEVLSKDTKDAAPLKLMVRKESLGTADLSDTSAMYVNFYNYLETSGTPVALDVYYQTEYVINTTSTLIRTPGTGISVTWAQTPPGGSGGQYGYYRVTTPEQLLTTITEKFGLMAPYVKIPMPPVDSFYYTQGSPLGQYRLPFDRPHTVFNFYLPGQSAATGATPYVQLVGNEYYGQQILNAQPGNSNTFGFGSVIPNTTYQTITSARGVSRSSPLVTSFELSNVYQHINQPTNAVRVYQTSMQRPPGAGLIP
jgi:hypothetical protein